MRSAAEKAGIKAGDVITRIDDAKVTTPADISNHVRTLRGKTVSVVLTRERKELTVSVTLEARVLAPGRIVGELVFPAELRGASESPRASAKAFIQRSDRRRGR